MSFCSRCEDGDAEVLLLEVRECSVFPRLLVCSSVDREGTVTSV